MKEIKEIVQAFDKACQANKKTALATVVQVEGSSYRRAGARMLITEDGELTGAISGGCLEGDALRKALLVMSQQKPMLATYDTTDEDDAKLGIGLGCNGIIHILIEPIEPEKRNPVDFFRSLLKSRHKDVLVTLFSLRDRSAPQYGTCLLYSQATSGRPALPGALLQEVLDAASDALRNGKSALKECAEDGVTAFVELVNPPILLNILGAGNDARPLVKLASVMGWEINVFDGRPNYPTSQRFPEARRVLVAKPDQVLDNLTIDHRTIFVIMTHNYNYDLAMLRQLIPLEPPYIGVLGPKSKLNRMLDELRNDEGLIFTDEQLDKVYGPVGLEIGAETSEEIALSIAAEINAVIHQKSGRNLRLKADPIHFTS